jgi:hypothetical protein
VSELDILLLPLLFIDSDAGGPVLEEGDGDW